ncbi:hypothetical protein AOCH_003289 [Aspergillus ochraceoroseus]|uniref:Uncharacterized protein n=2 Tax=Aspergillus ochraceoroseus TaxID=138278 RepID=A0A0F8UNK0_9EURO|nr:hypothetical protein AOCH_003289 [Aspergillus ochraceoroseus]
MESTSSEGSLREKESQGTDAETKPPIPLRPKEADIPSLGNAPEGLVGASSCLEGKSSTDEHEESHPTSELEAGFTGPSGPGNHDQSSFTDCLEVSHHSLPDIEKSCSEEKDIQISKDHNPRSDAITLIRARTLIRVSPPEDSPPEVSPLKHSLDQLNKNLSSSGDQSNEMVYEHASIMEFVTKKKPKKKKKKKTKKKAATNANSCDLAEGNQDHTESKPEPQCISPSGNFDQCEEGKETSIRVDGQAAVDLAGKGKQHATTPDPLEKREASNNTQLNQQRLLPVRGKTNHLDSRPETPQKEANAKSPSVAASSSPSSLSRQSSRKSAVLVKESLPAIREVSGKNPKTLAQVEHSGALPESQILHASTPKSSATESTAWSNTGTRITPQTTGPSDTPIKGTRRGKHHKSGPSTSQANNTRAAQAHLSTPSSTGTRHASTHRNISTQKPEGFFWQLDSHGFPCAKSDCDKRCNLWDGATVICPRCGPYSETRYCSRKHLLEDIKAHWISCGELVFRHPCRESSIPRDVREGAPLVPCLHQYDTPERHRQAVYFNANARKGDYFIFSDWADMVDAGFPENNIAIRCSNKLVHTVEFSDPEQKDRFRRVLAACLFMTIEAHELVDYLFRLIRDTLRAQQQQPSSNLETALMYQIHQEFAVTIQPPITGERHACDTDWDGRNRRNCPDPVCRAEFRRLLGSLGGRGHSQLVDHLEGSYWVLRAARTTHPAVKDTKARMRGEGFDEVAEEDRKVFRRGDGWDGAGSGEMEIEGINA